MKHNFISYAFILVYIFERLLELFVNNYNKAFMVNRHFARIKFPNESLQMKTMHILWFFGLIVETYQNGKLVEGFWFTFLVAILIIAQALRWYAIYTLGPYWSIDIYEMKEHPLITDGPYAFIRHPNYLAVGIEFIFLPLLLGCYKTQIVGAVANYFMLKRRIALEEQALSEQASMKRIQSL